MGLLKDADREQLEKRFAATENEVTRVLFTQENE